MSRAFAAALVTAVATACASGASSQPDPFRDAESGRPQEIRIRVENLNFSDARLYTISTTGRKRLGMVGGKQTAVFTVPWDFSLPLRVEIDLLAGPTCTTEELYADPGDTFELQIAVDFGSTPYCR